MTMTLYHFTFSGHSHRVRLMLSLLGADYEARLVDLAKGEHKSTDYLTLNPLGEVPTLVDDNRVVTDSTAALVYLAKKYSAARWLPEDPYGSARVQRWLSAASGELFRGPYMCRAIKRLNVEGDYDAARRTAERLFGWMQMELAARTWLAADHPTIADVALYSYVRVADEGGLDLSSYPAILQWLDDVGGLDGFEPMPRLKAQ